MLFCWVEEVFANLTSFQVEFEAPVGYKEPGFAKKEEKPEEENVEVMEEDVNTFSGSGNRLDGKKKKEAQLSQPVMKKVN